MQDSSAKRNFGVFGLSYRIQAIGIKGGKISTQQGKETGQSLLSMQGRIVLL